MSPDVLEGGSWVTTKGVARWVPAPCWVAKPPPDLTKLIACLTCGAKVTERCKAPSGATRFPHVGRLAPKLCPCGELPSKGASYCLPCSRTRKTVSNRESKRRSRQTERKAA